MAPDRSAYDTHPRLVRGHPLPTNLTKLEHVEMLFRFLVDTNQKKACTWRCFSVF